MPLASAHKRRLLRRAGLRASDLDAVGRAHLELWARSQAKLDLLDRWIAEHGLVDADGRVPGFMSLYVSLLNSCRLALSRFADHVRARGDVDPSIVVQLQRSSRRPAA